MKHYNHLYWAVLIIFGFLSSCEEQSATLEVEPKSVKIFSTKETKKLNVTILSEGEEVSDFQVSWTSIDPEIVTVDEKGRLTPISTGQGVVTAKVGELEEDVLVDVMLCSHLEVENRKIRLSVGQTDILDVQVLDENNKIVQCPLSFEVENEEVAQVDEEGNIVGILPGQTSVKIHAGEKSTSVSVTVEEPEGKANKTAETAPIEE